MSKKAQITLFIIIGLVIMFMIAVVFYLRSQAFGVKEDALKMPLELRPVGLFVDSCIKKTAQDGINIVSKQGGYYILPEKSTYNVSYFYYLGEPSIPALETIESELFHYLIERFSFCLDDFRPFKEQGFEIITANFTADVVIREKDVLFDVNYPVTIKRENMTAKLNKFNVIITSSLKRMYDISNKIIEKQEEDPYFILISEIIEIGDNNNVTFALEEDDYGNVIYSLVDREPIVSEFQELELEQEYYKFSFAAKYPK